MQICCNSGRISTDDAGKVKRQFSDFCSGSEDEPIKSQFVSYDAKSTRLDTFYAQLLANGNTKVQLWDLIKQILILSHGNAAVESGFSINNDLCTVNMPEESIVHQHYCVRFDTRPQYED